MGFHNVFVFKKIEGICYFRFLNSFSPSIFMMYSKLFSMSLVASHKLSYSIYFGLTIVKYAF